ncbi:MAG: PadR family transcriptional regulator [Saprospiraceae bacterium]|nr:PadR family transcriptional regulator [Saprospiraceae bacterium]
MKKGSKIGEFEEIVILTVGVLGDNAYGVAIKDEIEDRVKREVSVGALQTTLRRLEKKGFLAAKQGATSPTRGGRPKLFFSITPYGKKAIQESRDVRNSLWDALPPGLINEIA